MMKRGLTPLLCLCGALAVQAATRPSLFRGVVVADSPVGVRVVSLEETSQASLNDLRPEDVIVQINEAEIHSIDEFAAVSSALKGQAVEATVLVFRNGQPQELRVHLYSVPILRSWGIEVEPEHDIRFAQPETGLAYWSRLGQGFERAGKWAEALDAYCNGLHNVPDDLETAAMVDELLLRASRERLADGDLAGGLRVLSQAVTLMERLVPRPVSAAALERLREALRRALEALRVARLKTRQVSRILMDGACA